MPPIVIPSQPSPKSLSRAERAVIARDIHRAQETLERARKSAALGGDWRLAKNLGEQCKQLGSEILQLNGTPPIAISELLPG